MKLACPLSFLLPLCHAGESLLEKVGTHPLFDRNVMGLVAQFAVRLILTLARDSLESYARARFTRILRSREIR